MRKINGWYDKFFMHWPNLNSFHLVGLGMPMVGGDGFEPPTSTV
jgi:hypothetical protein